MAKVETNRGVNCETTHAAEVGDERGESFTDRGLSVVAMTGAVGGALAGAVLGGEVGTAFPIACGTLGTMLGSGLAAGGWCLLAHIWTALFAGHEPAHERDTAARSRAVSPSPSAG